MAFADLAFENVDTKRVENFLLNGAPQRTRAVSRIVTLPQDQFLSGGSKLQRDLAFGQKFLDEKGVFLPDSFRPDNLHPQAKGYDIWGQAVSAKLAELMR